MNHAQVQNLIFIAVVLLVAAGAMAYMMLRGDFADGWNARATITPQASAALTPEQRRDRFEAAPVSVLLTQLKGDGRLHIQENADGGYSVRLSSDPRDAVAALRLTEAEGRVTSLSWWFPLPAKPVKKPKSDIEKRIAANYEDALAAVSGRVETILTAAIDASDLNGKLLEPTLRLWCQSALETAESDKTYRNTEEGCSFSAYVSEKDGARVLECALLLP